MGMVRETVMILIDHRGMMNHDMMDQTMDMMVMMRHNSMMNMTMVHLVLEDMMEDKDQMIDGMDNLMAHLINRHDQILVVMVAEIRMMITLVVGMEADMDGLIVV